MSIQTVMPWLLLGFGVIQTAAAIRYRRAGHPRVQTEPGVMSMALGISLMTSGWVRAIAWGVMGVYFVLMTARLFSERTLSGLLIAIPLYALMLVIAVTELVFDDLSTWQRVLFVTVAAFVAAALVAMTVHLVQRLRTRPSTS